MAEVARSIPRLKVLIVGEADDEPRNQIYERHLKALTQSLGLSDMVTFTGFRSDIPRIMALLDVMVHSSSQPEPFGRVIIEALAAGTPLVATKAGGVLDVVEDGVHGLLVPPKDAHAMAKAVATLLSDRRLAERLTTAGRRRVLECFTVKKYATAVQDVYQTLFAE